MEPITIEDLDEFDRTQLKIFAVALVASGMIVTIRALAFWYLCKKQKIKTVPKSRKRLKRILDKVVRLRGGSLAAELVNLIINATAQQGSLKGIMDTLAILSSLGSLSYFLRLKRTVQFYLLFNAVPGNLIKPLPISEKNIGAKLVLYCKDYRVQFLLQVLNSDNLDYAKRIQLFRKELVKLNFKDVAVLVCFLSMLLFLHESHIGLFYATIGELMELLKSGKLSQRIARLIIRHLKRRGIYVDPALVDAAYN